MTKARAQHEASEPTRTCVACRAKGAQSRMLRFCASEGRVTPRVDLRHGPRTGRSAYLCPQRRCFDVAAKRRAMSRALAGPRGRTRSLEPIGKAEPLWQATLEALEREIHLLQRSAQFPQAHPRLIGLEKLLFELSSHPAPSDRRASAGKGGSPTHG